MKKNMKVVVLIYIGVALFTYALTLRVDRLESQGDKQINSSNSQLAFRIK